MTSHDAVILNYRKYYKRKNRTWWCTPVRCCWCLPIFGKATRVIEYMTAGKSMRRKYHWLSANYRGCWWRNRQTTINWAGWPMGDKAWLALRRNHAQIPLCTQQLRSAERNFMVLCWRSRTSTTSSDHYRIYIPYLTIELENDTARFTFHCCLLSRELMSMPYLSIWVLSSATRVICLLFVEQPQLV